MLTNDKKLVSQPTALRESGAVQRSLAACSAALDAAAIYGRAVLERLWDIPDAVGQFTLAHRAQVRAGLCHLADQAARAVDQLGELATSDATRRGSGLERALRDARMLRMHAGVDGGVLERAGKAQLGLTAEDRLH